MSIGFSQTFRLDLDLLSRILSEYVGNPEISPGDLGVRIGIGRRKVDGMNGWLKLLRLRDPQERRLTDLGSLIANQDPRMQDLGTAALLHYLIASNEDADVWFGFFNNFATPFLPFSRNDLQRHFENQGVTSSRLGSDISNLLKMYVDSDVRALTGLSVLEYRDSEYVRLPAHMVPYEILAFGLFDYLATSHAEPTTSILRLLTEPGRVGKIFGFQEKKLRAGLEEVENAGWITIVHGADIDGISYSYSAAPLDLISAYYERAP